MNLTSAFLVTWLAASIRLAGPILLAALGETFAERSGVLNVGIEGAILLGALTSFLISNATGSPSTALLGAMLVGIAASLLLAWMYVTVRASQVVVGLVFNVLALGIAATVYRRAMGHSAGPESVAMFQPIHLGRLSSLPASGENPKAADAAGVSVARMRYAGVLISGATAGLSGAYLVLAQIGLFRESIVAGQGFIALGIVIFGRWTPWKAALAALVFGACEALQLSLQLLDTKLPPQLLLALPYLVTILAISGVMGGKAISPAALMVPYSKDE
jgi:simple sugar transport system permease protein